MMSRSLLATSTGGTFCPFTSSLAAGTQAASHFPVPCQNEVTAVMFEADPTILLLVNCGQDMWLPKSQQRNQIQWQRAESFHLLLINSMAAIKTDTSLTACNEYK